VDASAPSAVFTVCMRDGFNHKIMFVSEGVNERRFAGDVCRFRKCSFVFAMRLSFYSVFSLSDLFW